jgi:two-component system chemotaxis sensor kinase CheA
LANELFLSMFLEEAREVLQALEAGLMDLEAKQADRAHVDRTFRAAHTLKGAAGMVGLSEIARFTHGVEAVLDRIRSGQLPVTAAIISTLLSAKDYLSTAVEGEANHAAVPVPEPLVARLNDLAEGRISDEPASHGPRMADHPAEAPADRRSENRYRILLVPGPDLLRAGIDPLGILDELRDLGQAVITPVLDQVPALFDLDPDRCDLTWTIDLTTTANGDRINDVFLFLDESSSVTVEEVEAGSTGDAEPTPQPTAPTPGPASRSKVAAARIRVDADRLDELVGMAGELAILTDNLQGLGRIEAAAPWGAAIEALERLGARMRDATLELRMVPIEELFMRFPLLVRDLAERSGKKIDLKIEGGDTQLDRTIIERLSEPMIHLIRNAIDHGVEMPAERIEAGKSPTGRITIGAGHEGDRVSIRIEEDGRGLDRARIARKGIALGLLPPDATPNDPRVTNVIFEPGFSTREQVGELSGRGVGLDVVRDAIRALRGSVTLQSVEGRGTSFTIRLPLTLAMIDGLLVEADGARFVVPMGQVEECVALGDESSLSTMGRQSGVVRGELVPILSLRELLNASQGQEDDGRRELLLTRHAEQRVGLAVDRLLGRVQAVIQPLSEGLSGLRHFSGATILGDGAICLILDLPTLVSEAQIAENRAAVRSANTSMTHLHDAARPLP